MAILAAMCVSCQNQDEKVQPNILFIFSDDHATHAIGAYGSHKNNPDLHKFVQTPNLDKLAEQGVLFTNTFCANSICGPSRAAILTGKHGHRNGMLNNDTVFNGEQQTFPKILQAGGYETAWIGKWHLFSEPTGFDHWLILGNPSQQGSYYNPLLASASGKETIEGHTATIITDKAIEWLKSERDSNKPFFLAYSHKAAHREWMPGSDEYELYNDVNLPLPLNFFDDYANRSSALEEMECVIVDDMNLRDLKLVPPAYLTEDQLKVFLNAYGPENEVFTKANLSGKELAEWKYQRYMKDYLRTVASMDKEIGRILNYLRESGLDKNTIVMYSSDQGFFLGDHGWFDKRWMYDESIRMPLIIRWPGVIEPGSKNDELIQNVDFAPTFLEAAGITPPDDMQGKSFIHLFRNKVSNWREQAYYHYLAYPDYCMVQPHYCIRTKNYKLIYYYKIDEWELFDLEKDPTEMVSVFSDPTYIDIKQMMLSGLEKERISLGDTIELKATSRYRR
jgi:arylsulfatase A-like enzyme